MPENPLVSIIIPTYTTVESDEKPSEKLGRCLSGFIGQPYRPLQIIIVDDATPEPRLSNLAATVQGFKITKGEGVAIHYYRHETNMGQAVAFNTGTSMSTGKYIMPFNDDDFVCATWITKAVNALEQLEPDIGFVYADYIYTEDWKNFKRALPPPQAWDRNLMKEAQFAPVIAMYRGELMRMVPWDTSLDHEEDWDYILRFTKNGVQGFYIPDAFSFVVYKHHSSKSIADEDGVQCCNEIIKKRIAEGYYD